MASATMWSWLPWASGYGAGPVPAVHAAMAAIRAATATSSSASRAPWKGLRYTTRPAHQGRRDHRAGVHPPGHPVVQQLPMAAPHEQPVDPQRVVPLVVGEVVDGTAAPAEVEQPQRAARLLRRRVAGPTVLGLRVDERAGEPPGGDLDRPEPDAEHRSDQRHGVVHVRRRDLHLRDLADHTDPQHRRPG